MNNINLIGRLTKDAELIVGGKMPIAKFSLAVARKFKKDEVDFINCVAFGKTAELIEQYTGKGDNLAVSGRLQISKYEDKEGKNRTSAEVVIDQITLLGAKKKADDDWMEPIEDNNNDDLPF